MWQKLDFIVGNPSSYTQANSENIPIPHKHETLPFALPIFLSLVSIRRQSLDWIVLCPLDREFDNREPDSGLPDYDELEFSYYPH